MAHQPDTRYTYQWRIFTRWAQMCCSLVCGILFLILGGALWSVSASSEVVVAYQTGDTTKSLTLSEDLEGPVYIHYEIPSVLLNNKDYVISKDKDSVYTFFSAVNCDSADSREQVVRRRGLDTAFLSRVDAVNSTDLAPCGLVNIAMFTDSYALDRMDGPGNWQGIAIDESGVAWSTDDEAFDKVVEQASGSVYLKGDRLSWLSPGDFLEHWKVWQRTPPGQRVRNLWGVIEGGLTQGSYRIRFLENSPIWESWGVPERRVIISGKWSALGNQGAIQSVAGFMFAVAVAEIITFLVLLVGGFLAPSAPSRIVEVQLSPLNEADPEAPEPVVLGAPKKEPVHTARV